MYYTENNHNKVVLRDFYLSRFENGPITEPCGTPEYLGRILSFHHYLWFCFYMLLKILLLFVSPSLIHFHMLTLTLPSIVNISLQPYFSFSRSLLSYAFEDNNLSEVNCYIQCQ